MPHMARPAMSARPAAEPRHSQFRWGDRRNPMIKALLTPIILGLAVAMVIRIAMARRA
jgi:hypothetical protein